MILLPSWLRSFAVLVIFVYPAESFGILGLPVKLFSAQSFLATRKLQYARTKIPVHMARMGSSYEGADKIANQFEEPINDVSSVSPLVEKLKKSVQNSFGNQGNPKALQRPLDSVSRIEYTDAGTMQISIPSKGLGSDSLFSGAFAAAWFSAIVPATFATGGASLLFMLPFWAAGGLVAKTAVVDPFVSGALSVGEFYWKVENTYLGKTIQQKDGPTPQLRGAKAEIVGYVNDVPQAELKLYSESGNSAFGLGLSVEELEYLAESVNRYLQKMKMKGDHMAT